MLDKHLLLMEEALALEDVLAKQRHCHQAHHHHHQQHRQDAHHPLLRGVGRDLNQGTNKEKDDMHVLLPSPHGLILPLARAHCHTGHTQQAQQTHVVMPKAEEASPLRLQRPCGRLGEGDVLTSTVSNSAYLVLKTMAQAEGHCRPQASLFLAMPLRFPHVATLSAASASRVVLKVRISSNKEARTTEKLNIYQYIKVITYIHPHTHTHTSHTHTLTGDLSRQLMARVNVPFSSSASSSAASATTTAS